VGLGVNLTPPVIYIEQGSCADWRDLANGRRSGETDLTYVFLTPSYTNWYRWHDLGLTGEGSSMVMAGGGATRRYVGML
jgi:hypothetical protein